MVKVETQRGVIYKKDDFITKEIWRDWTLATKAIKGEVKLDKATLERWRNDLNGNTENTLHSGI